MWTTIYMTQNIDTAKNVKQKLEKSSIAVMLHRIRTEDLPGEDCYELLVPSAELNEALGIIIEE